MYLGDPTIFWFLRLLLFLILFICGAYISKTKKKSIGAFLFVAIISFALVEGLRWLRGTDYENYYIAFANGITSKDEPLYKWFISIVYFLRLNPTLVFVSLSGLLMWGIGINFKNFRFAAIWGLPLIYLMIGYQAENLVRQYMAISFLGFAYYCYFIGKYKPMYIWLIIAPLIHFSSLIASVVFAFLTWDKVKLYNVWCFVIAYLLAYFLWNPDWLSEFGLLLGALEVDDSAAMSVYINNAEHHFSTEGSLSAMDGIVISRSIINKIVYFFTDIAVIVVGYFACENNKKLILLYYFSFIGILCQVLFGDIQVLMRIGYTFSWMCPILVALVAVFNGYKKYWYFKPFVLFLLFSRYLFYGIIRQVGKITMAEGCMFIWDK